MNLKGEHKNIFMTVPKRRNQIKKGFFTFVELLLRVVVSPYLRSFLLGVFGAKVGHNVRVYEVQFINLDEGFRHLILEDDVHVGTGCCIDLSDKVCVRKGTTISPRVVILTHSDPGQHHKSPLCQHYPSFQKEVVIGPHSWIGANTTILAGSRIQSYTVVGAVSLVRGELQARSLYAGIPVQRKKGIELDIAE